MEIYLSKKNINTITYKNFLLIIKKRWKNNYYQIPFKLWALGLITESSEYINKYPNSKYYKIYQEKIYELLINENILTKEQITIVEEFLKNQTPNRPPKTATGKDQKKQEKTSNQAHFG